MHVLKTSINGNPNVGLYCYCNNEYCLVGMEVPKKTADLIGKVLGVPVHQITLCGTSLIGVFCAGNSKTLLVPEIAFDSELKILEKIGINYTVISARLTAFGNNILCNDKGCLVNPEFSADQKKRIRQALDVPLKPGTIAELETVGSFAALNSTACIVHRDISDDELEFLQDLIGVECIPSTVNMASPYIRSGLVCNDHGFVIGDVSGGPEIVNVEQVMGFLKKVKK